MINFSTLLRRKHQKSFCRKVFESVLEDIEVLLPDRPLSETSLIDLYGCQTLSADGSKPGHRRAKDLMQKSGIWFYYNTVHIPGYFLTKAYHKQGDTVIPLDDIEFILMWQPEKIHNMDDFYYTTLHEMAHWTGHRTRLNRKILLPKESPEYATEEITAWMAAECMGRIFGLEPQIPVAEYILAVAPNANLDFDGVRKLVNPVADIVQYLLDIEKQPERTEPPTEQEISWQSQMEKLARDLPPFDENIGLPSLAIRVQSPDILSREPILQI